ncbi:glycosyltransferase family 4 protein [Fredinandcohnia onubensis]|uniref:glycosyltransferase family 4 protein n=1 Tax=Fredinandcohnia onubensis TaxID=1571209 RepID=UPI000C0BDCF4|nr:glycosyltransferase family 4 protein [Fredinandcohnia onubensis]
MKVLHLNAGAETGGGMVHILSLLNQFNRDEFTLGVFEKGEMSRRAQELGIDVEFFLQKSRFDLSFFKNLIDYIKRNDIDIVHTHGPRANLYAFILKDFTKCKWVTTIHSDPRDDFLNSGVKGSLFTRLHFLSFKRFDHFFAISNRFKQMLISFGVEAEKITTIYNGIDFTVPTVSAISRRELRLDDNDFVVIMIARLHPVKGHAIAFKAIENIKKEYPFIKLLLVGDGPMKKELENLANYFEIKKNVLFLGHQENIHGLLAVSDVKILTSFSESFPLVILEAARAKIPVISTDVGGVKDLISDSSLGKVIPVDDAESLINALKEYIKLKNKGELKVLGENLNKKASNLYSLENFSDSIYEEYRQIL